MTKSIAYCALIATFTLVGVLSAVSPAILGTPGTALDKFVTEQVLNVLGVILAIMLASAANLHLEFNKIEERFRRKGGLSKTKASVRISTQWMIGLFCLYIVMMLFKPEEPVWLRSICNGLALIVLLWYVLIMIDLTQTIFKIEPEIPDD